MAAPSHYRLGSAAGRTWLMAPGGAPVAWLYTPAALASIVLSTDPFDEELVASVHQAVKAARERTALVGYTWAASDWSSSRVSQVRRLTAESAGKQQYVGYLKERYAYSIERVNQIYGLESTSFSDLLTESFARLDLSRAEVVADDRQFLVDTAGRVAQALAEALHAAHPGALLFSEPLRRTSSEIAAAMASHVDVLVSDQLVPAARAQVLLGDSTPATLPPNVVGLSANLERLSALLPIPQN